LALAAPPREHIDETLVRFVSAFNEGDAATAASFYTEDAALLPPDAQPVNGRDAIQAFWQGAIDAGMKIGMLRATEVDARGDLAYEVGGFKLLVPGESGTTEVVGKYIVVWKRGDHTWRLPVTSGIRRQRQNKPFDNSVPFESEINTFLEGCCGLRPYVYLG
jgi:ketosteroid isomerase-like protein